MHLDEIPLNNASDKGEIIEKYIGKEVVIKDSIENWCHGKIQKNYINKEEYKLLIQGSRGERVLKYDNLEIFLLKRDSHVKRF